MVLNATFNNSSVISWRSVLLVKESGVPVENHRLAASPWQTLSHNVVSSTPRLLKNITVIQISISIYCLWRSKASNSNGISFCAWGFVQLQVTNISGDISITGDHVTPYDHTWKPPLLKLHFTGSEWLLFNVKMSNCPAISWQEQVTFNGIMMMSTL